MGVHGLWKLLESTGKPINPETLEGKILAVDISIWLNQAVKGVRDREGNSVQNAHLLTLFNRLCKLLFFRIRPVFIFDGEAPLLKKQTLANRRQRKEEMSVASRQTNEKLLKTFLKRQAIRAAMGGASQEPLPSISSVRREEVDDIYVLPALEKNEQSSEDEAEAEWEENIQNQHGIQDEIFQNLNSMDIDSEEFAQLPAEMKHEILRDMKEFSKRRRTMFQKPPEKSKEFSQYQLAGLLNRNKLNQRMEGVEREMAQRGLGVLQEENRGRTVEARSLVSEDTAHYVLIKGSKSEEKTSEKEVTSVPWTSCDWVGRQKPEPLWHPLSEKSPEKKPSSLSKNPIAQDVAPSSSLPPSPRTLKAIQAAMNSSSDEESHVSSPVAVRSQQPNEQLSPRTLLAIQRALTEEEADPCTPVYQSSTRVTPLQRSPIQQLTDSVNSSEREMDDSTEKKDVRSGSLLDSKELSVNCGNVAVSNVGLTPPDSESSLSSTPQLEEEAEKESKPDTNPESEPLNSPHGLILERYESEGSGLQLGPRLLPSDQCSPPSRQQMTCVPDSSPEDSTQVAEEVATERVCVTTDDDNDSEANFIDVSDLEEEESEEEGKEEEPVPEEVSTKEMRSEGGSLAEPPSHGPPQLDGADEEKERIQSSQETLADAADKQWEHMDVEELLQLESTLQSEQSTLEAQKQQQERMATTITGQMYLESQELLRLFGVPYFVAPMEAEAQCAVLERLDQTHGTITDDSDIWLFGGRHVYKNFFTHNKYVELYQYLDIQNQLGLDQSKLINLAYLLGSDYTEGVPGVGYVTGMEILNEFPGLGLEPLTNFSKWWSEAQENKKLAPNPNDTKVKKKLRKILLPPGFPNPVVAQAYLHPTVDDSCTSFSWGQPHMELIKDFCLSRFGWSSRRTEEVLQPVMKQLNMHQKQLRIDSFFRLEQQERQVIRSQRLRRAVTCLKRKEEEEENSMEEGACSPVKAKNMKSTETKAEGSATWGGGFLASQDVIPNFGGDEERTTEGSETLHTPPEAKSKLSPIKAGRSSSSSEGDSDTDIGVAMVTARSVFENKPRGRGRRSGRGRNPRKR
ncbi:DNA repair protein complementing XP-G cells homolog isoform X2 [Scleropages formosus]|uniref:DNA repair protein complementing XP-G cells homolog isoform X2 n=1 Tax=Scleropages formosus TaxID=113540 RepID=UPI0008786B44|nr:DNA repair protein complementing XP-G cells isoform X2 [Scleropages formosus]